MHQGSFSPDGTGACKRQEACILGLPNGADACKDHSSWDQPLSWWWMMMMMDSPVPGVPRTSATLAEQQDRISSLLLNINFALLTAGVVHTVYC